MKARTRKAQQKRQTDLKRYELFGWDYEHHCPLSKQEVDWYKRFLYKTGGPVLELACGTGRLLTCLAKESDNVVGIDLSSAMLNLANERISQLPIEIQERIQVCSMDMSNFRFNQIFCLILIADNSFRELKSKDEQRSCLKCVRDHLQTNGKVLVTVRRFDPTEFIDDRRNVPWSDPMRHPTTGGVVTRKIERRLIKEEKLIRGAMIYKTIDTAGRETIEEFPFEAPAMLKGDYISLFVEAGLSPNVFVDYEEKEDDGMSGILCFVCDVTE